MKPNKSIDGLTTRSAKKQMSKPAKTTKPAKTITVNTPAKPEKKPVAKFPKPEPTQTVDDFLKPVQAFDFDGETGELKKAEMNSEENTTKKDNKKAARAERKAEKKAAKLAKNEGKKSHRVRNTIVIILLVIVLAASGFIIWAVTWGNDIIAKITGGQGNVFDLLSFMDENYNPLKTDSNGRTNILAIGTSGYNMDGDEGNGTHAGAQLTDSIMMISLNQDTGDVVMLSLPRDLKASPTCTATGKINEVYWCNGGGGDATIEEEAAAAGALMEEVGTILGVEFQYFAHLNWAALEDIIDAIGGITIKLDEDVLDYGWTGAVFEAGVEYEIDGDQAVGLARARHGTVGGDFSRGTSQQKILIGIKNKLVSQNLGITEILSLAGSLGDNLRTNFSMDEIKTLAHISKVFDLESMRQISLFDPANNIYYMKTANINGISYVIPSAGVGNYTTIHNYIEPLMSSDPRSYEQPSIAIMNAKDEAGLAAAEKAKLEEAGYTIEAIDNITGDFPIAYQIYVTSDKVTGTKQMLEDYYCTNAITGDDIPEYVPRDYDIIIVLGPSSATPATENEEQ